MTQVPLLGVLLALVFYAISASPSLLPRRWWYHGLASGPFAALGYSIGWALTEFVQWIADETGVRLVGPPELFDALRWIIVILVLAWTIWMCTRAFLSSKRAAQVVGIKPVSFGEYLLALLATAVMFAATMAIVYLLKNIFILLVAILDRWLPSLASWAIALITVTVLVLVVSNKVVFKLIMAYFARAAQSLNDRSNAHLRVPTVPERSGSPESSSTWDSIGGQGRLFLGFGPSAEEITEVTGRPAMEPVRVYVGLPKGEKDPRPLAVKAVEELKRAGGLNRSVLVVYTATGSGWVDEWVCQPLEYMTDGDCAVVSIQYSYLFSAAMMVSDLTPCADAGRALFEEVEKEVLKLPEDRRPLLVVAGESLGAYGSQAAFEDEVDLRNRTDGAIWVGSPNSSNLSLRLTSARQKGSPEVAPVVDSGKHVRFITRPEDLESDLFGREYGKWHYPRTVFVQHASDPVVRYSPTLAFREPDWLRERVGPDVSPAMKYTPIATLFQVITDLPVAGLAPAGHGHTYHGELLNVWMKILGLDEPTAQGRIPSGDWITPEMRELIAAAIETDLKKYHKSLGPPPTDL
ncbi:alpha/beta-hydrolase family protein [Actinomycetaceae bacterium MB13-C1-2]|nr:alpha/beta-hydrolase family protein [Actinomycetaceae bacterium MB13-C1-2]